MVRKEPVAVVTLGFRQPRVSNASFQSYSLYSLYVETHIVVRDLFIEL